LPQQGSAFILASPIGVIGQHPASRILAVGSKTR
jgi:hypothetical protein